MCGREKKMISQLFVAGKLSAGNTQGKPPTDRGGTRNQPCHTTDLSSVQFLMGSGKSSPSPARQRQDELSTWMSSAQLFRDSGTRPGDHEPG